MKNKLAALINDSRQYSEDGRESCPHIIDIDENTTIGDLIKWHDSIYQRVKRKFVDRKMEEEVIPPDFFNQIHIISKK